MKILMFFCLEKTSFMIFNKPLPNFIPRLKCIPEKYMNKEISVKYWYTFNPDTTFLPQGELWQRKLLIIYTNGGWGGWNE